jgi:hypothetical protein
MAAAILTQGFTQVVTAISDLVSHVAVTEDQTAFNAAQTVMNPDGTSDVLTKAASTTQVNASTVNKEITITGATEFTDQYINAIGACSGTATTGAGTDTLTRTVRSFGIGVQDGDIFTIGVQLVVEDNS